MKLVTFMELVPCRTFTKARFFYEARYTLAPPAMALETRLYPARGMAANSTSFTKEIALSI